MEEPGQEERPARIEILERVAGQLERPAKASGSELKDRQVWTAPDGQAASCWALPVRNGRPRCHHAAARPRSDGPGFGSPPSLLVARMPPDSCSRRRTGQGRTPAATYAEVACTIREAELGMPSMMPLCVTRPRWVAHRPQMAWSSPPSRSGQGLSAKGGMRPSGPVCARSGTARSSPAEVVQGGRMEPACRVNRRMYRPCQTR